MSRNLTHISSSLFTLIFVFAFALGSFGAPREAHAMLPVDGGGTGLPPTGGGGGIDDGGGGGGDSGGGGTTGGGTGGGGSYCGKANIFYDEVMHDVNACQDYGYTATPNPSLQFYRTRSSSDNGYDAFMDAMVPSDPINDSNGGVPVNLNQCGYAKPSATSGYILTQVWEDPTPPTCDSTPAPTANLSASPTTIDDGESTKLTWSSANATSCSIDHSVLGSGGATSGSKNVSPSGTITYTLTCTGAGGTDTDTAKVTVNPAPEEVNVTCSVPDTAPIDTSVQWSSFASGGTNQSTSYRWKYIGDGYSKVCTGGNADVTTNIQDSCPDSAPVGGSCSTTQAGDTCNYSGLSCTEQPDWICDGEGNCSDEPTYHVDYTYYSRYQCQATVSSSDPTYTYSWSGDVTGSSQNVSKSYSSTGTKTGTVRADAQSGYATAACSTHIKKTTASLTANPSSITAGQSSTLSWTSQDAGVCTSPDFDTDDDTSGSVTVSPSSTKTYHIHCEGEGGEDDDTATVTVTAAPQNDPLTASCSVNDNSITAGGQATWTANRSGGTGSYTYTWSGSASGTSQTSTKTFNTAGTYNASVTVKDSSGASKNVSCPSVTVTTTEQPPPSAADLTSGSVTLSDAAPTVDDPMNFRASVSNIGGSTSGGFPTRFQVANASHTQTLANVMSGGYLTLAAGESSTVVSSSYTFSAAGTYSVRACANQNASGTNITTESDYGNNCGPWRTVTVGDAVATVPSDLTAGSVTPTSVAPDEIALLQATISNIGAGSTVNGFTALFQRSYTSDGSTAVGIDTTSVSFIAAGSSRTASIPYTFPTTGTYYVRACADKSSASDVNGDIAESNENNNCGAWTKITVGSAPAGLSCTVSDSSVTQGDHITYTAHNGSGSDYTWSTVMPPTPIGGSFAHTSSISVSASITGTYRFKVQNNGDTATCPDVTVGQDESGPGLPSTACRVDKMTIAPGESVTYTSTLGGGDDNYENDYYWGSIYDGEKMLPQVYPSTNTITRTYKRIGVYKQAAGATGHTTVYCPAVVVTDEPICSDPEATITADKDRVQPGDSVILTYSASGIDGSCTVTGPGVSKSATANACNVGSSNTTTPGITTQSTYTISCDGGATDSVTINVVPKFEEF